jgi:hypothetical protein
MGHNERNAAGFRTLGDPVPPRFRRVDAQALWNIRLIEDPTPADALAITKALRTHGGMEGRRLADRMESVCRAPH